MYANDNGAGGSEGSVTSVAAEDWQSWCHEATEDLAGRTMTLRFQDRALGEVQLAEGQPFVAIEFDQLGPSVALTVKYGDGVVPVRYVIADPREVQQHRDDRDQVRQVAIVDGTGRRIQLSLEQGGAA